MQVGDGAIVVRDDAGYRPLFWLQRGEYANMTHFVTEFDATDRLAFACTKNRWTRWRFSLMGFRALRCIMQQTQHTHRSSKTCFRPLRAAATDEAAALGEPLAAYRASEAINRRTDDDKTLLLVTRRAPEEAVQPAAIASASEVSAAGLA